MGVHLLPLLGIAALAAGCAPAAPPTAPTCTAFVPTEIKGEQPRWLGECAGGKAAGVGVLRVGARAPFAFFFGRAAASRPQTGLIMLASGNMIEIRGLTPSGGALSADGDHLKEQDQAWADAAAGARLVAGKFRAAGNAGSAAYYANWAHKIETQRPE